MMFPCVDSCQGETFVASEYVILMSMYDFNDYVVQFKRSCITF